MVKPVAMSQVLIKIGVKYNPDEFFGGDCSEYPILNGYVWIWNGNGYM